jgi:hypothetical protein
LRQRTAEVVSSPAEEADCGGGRLVGGIDNELLPLLVLVPSECGHERGRWRVQGPHQPLEELPYPFESRRYGRGTGKWHGF